MKKLATLFIILIIILTTACSALPTSQQPAVTPVISQSITTKTNTTPSPTEAAKDNALVYGCIVPPTGDFCKATELKNSTDSIINALLDNANIISLDKTGTYVVNKGVCESFGEIMNQDGSKTFSIKLRSGLKYCDGTAVEAKDYLIPLLIYGKNYSETFGVDRMGAALIGSDEYYEATCTYFSGVRLIDNTRFELTVKADRLPYFYDILYADTYPMNSVFWIGQNASVKDDGMGAYITGLNDADNVRAKLESARWQTENRISCGPYKLKSYDTQLHTVLLEKNEYYLGNFEGVKPTIETIVFECIAAEDSIKMLSSGELDIVDPFPNTMLSNAETYVKEERLMKETYSRNGYGKLLYQCDSGPTQFASVRHAIAYLLDRDKLVENYCANNGMTVDGPYSEAMWMYTEMKDRIYAELNHYQFNADKAVQLLEEDGWIYDGSGNDYSTGIRYKTVSESEMNSRCITLTDGRILMPLIIDWCSTDNNTVADLVNNLLNSHESEAVGISFVLEKYPLDEMLKYLYRDKQYGEQYSSCKYCMYSLATDYTAAYDYSYTFTLDPQLRSMGYNLSYSNNELLNRLSMEMVNTVEHDDNNAFKQKWFEFVKQFNEYLPELPLYSNDYSAVFTTRVESYEPTALFNFSQAVLYAKLG